MATTLGAIKLLLQGAGKTNTCGASWDNVRGVPLTAAARATVITALEGGTITTEADALALMATAATGGVSQRQVWDVLTGAATQG